ncbi:MAG: hypothetical protein VX938_07135, partial [Myxococcota bacterium]|nr:hypothetical protein [Myxococcota bacterium]
MGLPESVHFRTRTTSFNRRYAFVIHQEQIFFRNRVPDADGKWRLLPVHPTMTRPVELSADDENLMVVDDTGHLFTMFKGLEEEDAFRWTARWGHPFWYGPGITMPKDALTWDASFMSPAEDKYWLAPSGNRHDVGQGCTNAFVLRGDGQRITYLDPWLPSDYSYELATPHRGRFVARTMSASGSTILLQGHHGELYTINFDFDQVGADTLFFNYSYQASDWETDIVDQVVPRGVPRPLPIPDWRRQDPPPGPFTDRITLFKIGEGGTHRTLRIEGMNAEGQTGFWTRDIQGKDWTFVQTNLPLVGTRLDGKDGDAPLGPDTSLRFVAETPTSHPLQPALEVPDLHPWDHRSTLRVFAEDGAHLDLTLHHRETIRTQARPEGLDRFNRPLFGAVEVPEETLNRLDELAPDLRRFIRQSLRGA